jgi:predicted amino acid-binding ACT domain protein
LRTCQAVPHGIYDIRTKLGFITIGVSKDTSEFACDCIRRWWHTVGKEAYKDARTILILCDGGGSNSSRAHLFKEDLEKLAKELGVDIRIAHYPPYCSKYNPIEHLLFPHVTRAIRGANYTSVDMLAQAIRRTKTKTGVKVIVEINENVYETGRKYTPGYNNNNGIKFDKNMPQWNYVGKAA